ncbi:MAG: hypothetical protein ACTSUO_06550 [Candidatus Thorarchaeota archaeon]
MPVSLDEVLSQLAHVWEKHVSADYFGGNLYYEEQALHSSIAHHLRTHLKRFSDFRVWHEVNIDAIDPSLKESNQSDGRKIDLVLARAETSHLTNDVNGVSVPIDLKEVREIEILVAIEVKYASTVKDDNDNTTDIIKLADIRDYYFPDIIPVFAYIPGTDQVNGLDKWISKIAGEARDNSVSFLFGHPTIPNKWNVKYNQGQI